MTGSDEIKYAAGERSTDTSQLRNNNYGKKEMEILELKKKCNI